MNTFRYIPERRFAFLMPPLWALIACMTALMLSACNLTNTQGTIETLTVSAPLRTLAGTPTSPTPLTIGGAPTLMQRTVIATTGAQFLRPTAIVVLPPLAIEPTANISSPTSLYIISPSSGNVVAGSVQILGSASHPLFLQYQVEYGPDPNTGGLWYPATGIVQQPVNNGLLGLWNSTPNPDGVYQLRLRVFLRDGTILSSTIGGIRVQNAAPTPIPSNTTQPLPIAAFSQSSTRGNVPLAITFTNQSSGSITAYQWNFGDGTTSTEVNPAHTYTTPGIYDVTLTVTGAGGSSNVRQQINAQSPGAPVASYDASALSGVAPLNIQFTDTSTGAVNTYLWNFSDRSTISSERSPAHIFTVPGTYNVFLTVTGAGGTSIVSRTIQVQAQAIAIPPTGLATQVAVPTLAATEVAVLPTVQATSSPQSTAIPAPAAAFSPGATSGEAPLTVAFTNQSTGEGLLYAWDFNGDEVTDSADIAPSFTYNAPGTYTVTLTISSEQGTSTYTYPSPITISAPATQIPSETPTPTPTETPATEPLAAAAPVQPDLQSQPIRDQASSVIAQGAAQGRSTARFALAGDWPLRSGLLRAFETPGGYTLGDNASLQGLVDRYAASSDGAPNSFNQPGIAGGAGYTAQRLLDMNAADAALCQGQTPLQCQIAVSQASVIFIGVGTAEIGAGTSADEFRGQLQQVVQQAKASGALPILLTLPPLANVAQEQIDTFNNIILSIASAEQIPTVNIWRALQSLPPTDGALTAAPSGAGDLTGGAVASYTANAANALLLQTLQSLFDAGLLTAN